MVPRMPAEGLVTSDVLARREAKVSTARIRKMALITGVVVSALVFAAVAASTILDWKRDMLLDEIAQLTPRASSVAADKGRWDELAAAVDRDRSVLEMLYRLGEVPSVHGVTLTKFEIAPGVINVSGKAARPGLGLKFGGDVTAGAYLPEYRWEFPAPAIANDNTATFELKGTLTATHETES